MSQVDLDAENAEEKTALALQALRKRRQQLIEKVAHVDQHLETCGDADRQKLLDLKSKILAALEQEQAKIDLLVARQPDPEDQAFHLDAATLQQLLHQRDQQIQELLARLEPQQKQIETLESELAANQEQLDASRQGLSEKLVELRIVKKHLDNANKALAEKGPSQPEEGRIEQDSAQLAE